MRFPKWRSIGLGFIGLASALRADGASTAPDQGCIVATDGSGQYSSIQEAINASPQSCSAASPWTIHVKPGTYHEIVYVQREKHHVRLLGEDPATTVLTFGLFASMPGIDGKPLGTFHTPTLWVDADDFTVENITLANSAGRVGQALALRVDGDRDCFLNCRFKGWQDTILANRGRQYFADCSIEGAVDFIFGGSTAFFERCAITCLGDGYVTAASTPQNQRYGLVFDQCSIEGPAGVQSYLGRPWRSFAMVLFVNSRMSGVVRPAGWHNWNKPEREMTTRFGESGSLGPGADLNARVPWARPVAAADAASLNADKVLAGDDGWHPE